MSERTFHPVTKRFSVAAGGRINSKDVGLFVEQVADDFVNAATVLAAQVSRIEAIALATKLESEDLRERVRQLEKETEQKRLMDAGLGRSVQYTVTCYDGSKISFLADSAVANRPHVDTVFGLATVPLNAVEHRFMIENTRTGSLSPYPELVIDITGTFDAGDGQGVVNHESGATIDAGTPEYAFNGNNTKRWVRKLEYPLYEDVTEVMTEITVTLPEQASSMANLVYVVPFPEGDVDILGIYSSPDLGNSFTLIPGFEETLAAGPSKFVFPAQSIQRLKVRFRNRNWVEENGKKVFYIGAQEIGLQLVDWDKDYAPGGEPVANHTLILRADAPEGYEFSSLTFLSTLPMFNLETAGQRHVHVKLDTVGDGSNVVWSSDVDDLPQSAEVVLATPVATLYWLVTLNFASTTGGPSSPFPVGTTPVFKGLSFEAETQVS